MRFLKAALGASAMALLAACSTVPPQAKKPPVIDPSGCFARDPDTGFAVPVTDEKGNVVLDPQTAKQCLADKQFHAVTGARINSDTAIYNAALEACRSEKDTKARTACLVAAASHAFSICAGKSETKTCVSNFALAAYLADQALLGQSSCAVNEGKLACTFQLPPEEPPAKPQKGPRRPAGAAALK